MPHNPKKNAAIIPKIAAITPPPIPGPIYANTGIKANSKKLLITDIF